MPRLNPNGESADTRPEDLFPTGWLTGQLYTAQPVDQRLSAL